MFKSKRRKFSPEFNLDAIEQVRQHGVSCAPVARELGIGSNFLSRWKRQTETEGTQAFGGTGKSRDEDMARRTREERPGEPTTSPHN
ncbi:transposase [Pseudohongiella acticola]|uniref:Transposase n=1 Tax=Pseudohongiella acticola TaxID=1524254 RepID=A0A1E8CJZ3_9GAMM|nr:transposase [Pseudohongiella acticola]